jgi:hypothetical protein
MRADADAWGHIFRLGWRWFEYDAADAWEWLWRRGLITVSLF